MIEPIEARRYDTGEPVRIAMAGGRLAAVEPLWTRQPLDDWPWAAPGWCDLQINGYGGVWFNDPQLTPEQVAEVVAAYRARGVVALFPTLITASLEALEHGFTTIRRACDADDAVGQAIPGCHLEGPFLSPEEGPRGAHPVEYIRPCDWSEFERLQRASGGRIRLVTLAPESPGAVEFIGRAVQAGVCVALGHTNADGQQIAAAVAAGARLSTHLGNGLKPLLPRHPNPLWDQLAARPLWASVISDGRHLPASVLRAIIAAKGADRIIITCDASGLAGCQPGVYDCPSGRYEVLTDGRIVVAGQRTLLAGSALTTEVCIQQMVELGGVSLGVACDMAAKNPRTLLGLPPGRLLPGAPADLVVFDWRPGRPLSVRNVFVSEGAG